MIHNGKNQFYQLSTTAVTRTAHYIHGPRVDKRVFCCFIYVKKRWHALLLNVSVLYSEQTWKISVDPVPFISVINWTSVSANPDDYVPYLAVRITPSELLKHVVSVLICDDRQRWIPSSAKLCRFIPTQHWTTCVETVVLTVHRVTFGHFKCRSWAYRRCWNITCNIVTVSLGRQRNRERYYEVLMCFLTSIA